MRQALLALAVVALGLHLWQFRDFTVDDAAISYAYAQNLVQGHGLVNVAGGERVEAYTNFLWVICVAVGMIFTHDAFLVGRVLGVVAALLVLLGVAELLAALRGKRSPLDALPAFFVAALMPISYWSMSGLECGLYMALSVWLAVRLVQRDRTLSAILAAALALTRPDGILLLGVALVARLTWDRRPRWYLLALAPVAAHFAFRYSYYAFPLPNSFYVKARPFVWRELFDLKAAGWKYVIAAFKEHRLGPALLLALGSLLGFRRRVVVWGLFLATVAFPLYARGDWMAEGRFVAPALPLLCVLTVDGAEQLGTLLRWPRVVSLALMAGLFAWILPREHATLLNRQGRYPAPAHWVVGRGQHYIDVARALGVPSPFSVVEGDLGGTSYVNGFRIVDLGGLGDLAISRHENQPTAFREHTLAEERPIFLRLAGFWTRFRFAELPEFQEEYVPLSADYYGSGFWISRSAFLVRGVDTRLPLHIFDADGLDLIAADVNEKDVQLLILVRRQPATPLALGTLKAAPEEFPLQLWRPGEVLRVRLRRPEGPLRLCGKNDCVTLAEGHGGAIPPSLPPDQADAGELYRRGILSQEAGDFDGAYRDLWRSIELDRSRPRARRSLEEVRLLRRSFWSPRWRIRLLKAERQFALVPDETHLAQVSSAALAAGEPEAAVRLQMATGLAPEGDAARLDLAECDLQAGQPALGLPLLPEPTNDADAARVVRIAFAAGAPERARAAAQRLDRTHIPVAPGLVMTAAWARPGPSGDVELSLALKKIAGGAPESIDVGGRRVIFERPPATWGDGEIVEQRARLDLPEGKSHILVGSAGLDVEANLFSADFERGRAFGWSGPINVRNAPRWGVQGNFYAAGGMRSPPLRPGLDEICFIAAESGVAALEVNGRRTAQENGRGGDIFRPYCFSMTAGARLISAGMAIDDVECIAGGRPAPCAGEVEVR